MSQLLTRQSLTLLLLPTTFDFPPFFMNEGLNIYEQVGLGQTTWSEKLQKP